MRTQQKQLSYCVGFFLYISVQFFHSSLSPFGYDVDTYRSHSVPCYIGAMIPATADESQFYSGTAIADF
jgi:hypothetical protein